MFRRGAGDAARVRWREAAAPAATVLSLVVCAAAIALSPPDRVDALSAILGVAAVGAGVLVAGDSGGLAVSSSMIVNVLAAAFLGPAPAVACALIAEGAAAITMRTRWKAVLANVPPAILPAVAAAVIIRVLAGDPAD